MGKLAREFQDVEIMAAFLRESEAGRLPPDAAQRECLDSIGRALRGKGVTASDLALQTAEQMIMRAEGVADDVRRAVSDAYYKGLEKHPEHLAATLKRMLAPSDDTVVTALRNVMGMTVSHMLEHALDGGTKAVRNKVAEDIVRLCVQQTADYARSLSLPPPIRGGSLLQLVMIYAGEGRVDPAGWAADSQELWRSLYCMRDTLKALPPAPGLAPL